MTVRSIDAFIKDSAWLTSNYKEIQDKGHGVVVIKDEKILTEDDTMHGVLEKLDRLGESPEFLLIAVIPSDDVSFIL